ncbi:MAG: hypothetical protein U1E47_09365 [Rivihabitans pingtungensis]
MSDANNALESKKHTGYKPLLASPSHWTHMKKPSPYHAIGLPRGFVSGSYLLFQTSAASGNSLSSARASPARILLIKDWQDKATTVGWPIKWAISCTMTYSSKSGFFHQFCIEADVSLCVIG